MVDPDITTSLATTFAIVQTVALLTLMVAVWALALFMYKVVTKLSEANRELVLNLVQLKGMGLPLAYVHPNAQAVGGRSDTDPNNPPETFG